MLENKKAVIFDLDGTLVDSMSGERLIFAFWENMDWKFRKG